MSSSIHNLDKVFESRVRLGIMSLLMIEDVLDFNSLKEALKVTDGNLASHLRNLEKVEYVTLEKRFLGRKPQTTYRTTKLGRLNFNLHLKALENLIKSHK